MTAELQIGEWPVTREVSEEGVVYTVETGGPIRRHLPRYVVVPGQVLNTGEWPSIMSGEPHEQKGAIHAQALEECRALARGEEVR